MGTERRVQRENLASHGIRIIGWQMMIPHRIDGDLLDQTDAFSFRIAAFKPPIAHVETERGKR